MPLLEDWSLPNANIHAVYLERNQLSVKLRTFVDFLSEYLRRSPSSRSARATGSAGSAP
ncbi:hypothetical protein B0G57_11643 [Trinickia symbiotica]|nr:hypothetical protein B0G57_11643 [Trinickia symbiotica]